MFSKVCVIQLIFIASSLAIAGADVEHRGIFSNNLNDAHLIIPRKVDEIGQHISHHLNHRHQHDFYNESTGDPSDHSIHYHIDLHNETLHLELLPSTGFVAPNLVVERHKRDLRERHKRNNHQTTQCHYEGKIRGHQNSKVALSACNGLAGYIRTNKNEYLIEPSKNHKISQNGQHPHVVFHRSAVKKHHHDDKKKSKSHLQNHHHQQQQQQKKKKKRKRRHSSNCGTREPRRSTETKIEWQPQGKVIVQGGRKMRNHHHHHHQYHQNNHYKEGKRSRGDNGGAVTKKRGTRSVITPRHVEALVVADPTMLQFHEDGDVETYLLTIMNMVSSLYKDPTIGNSVQVVVVKIILLDEDDAYPDLNVTDEAIATLESFCRWQKSLNPKRDDDPNHHDVAILVTRRNICSVAGCATLGIANVGGMCRSDRSCSVNEDNGITLAHTITHELGHNFGMYHDTAKTGCDHRSGPILHIMTPSFEADTVQVSWSNCSRRDITHFLDQGYGRCLEDSPEPLDEYQYPELPAGAMYNADLQCRLQFNSTDEDIKVCSKLDEICSQLWCSINGTCTTLLRPAAPGTHCSRHKWCQDQKCVNIEELPAPVDGGWGNWSEWGGCSKECGAGISIQTRECDHPTPAHGGTFCIGERTRYKICNIDECPENEKTNFRAQQCASKNKKQIKGKYYSWYPFVDIHDPCKLYCTDKAESLIHDFDAAEDGTPCNLGKNDMCIAGICRIVGCDWVVDSNTSEDRCGICGGDGTTCQTVKGEFTKKINITEGYYEITLIPSGSRHIKVEEMGPSKNFIGVGKADSNEFYLNGDRLISMSGEYQIAGTMGLYERENEMEKLKIPGPIQDDIALYIVFKGKHKNLGIRFEYTLPANKTEDKTYHWKLSDFTPCTKTCGGGIQHRFSVCYKRYEGIVDDELCWANAANKRPDKITRKCNDEPCSANWWVGPWQPCPVTCQRFDDSTTPLKRRTILCVDQNEYALPPEQCEDQPRPKDHEPCSLILPPCNVDDEKISDNNELTDNEIPDTI